MKLVRLIKMCLPETYIGVRIGKNLCDIFPIRNGLNKKMYSRQCLSTMLKSTPLGVFM